MQVKAASPSFLVLYEFLEIKEDFVCASCSRLRTKDSQELSGFRKCWMDCTEPRIKILDFPQWIAMVSLFG
jgi:hypothetical protein